MRQHSREQGRTAQAGRQGFQARLAACPIHRQNHALRQHVNVEDIMSVTGFLLGKQVEQQSGKPKLLQGFGSVDISRGVSV